MPAPNPAYTTFSAGGVEIAPYTGSATQLAQLTQVEQAYNTNTNLQNMLNQSNNTANLSAVSFIGKEIVAPGTAVNLQSGSPAAINFRLSAVAISLVNFSTMAFLFSPDQMKS